MNLREIKEMVKLMDENDIREFELEREGFRVVLKRGIDTVSVLPQVPMQVSPQQPEVVNEKEVEGKEPSVYKDENLEEIVTPMVGTFYSQPSPESDFFVQKGEHIKVGQVVCIIEAMKVMNEIKSEISGIVEEILIDNGEAVEFGQALFRIRKG
ncbi:acetyl-CoA carboxylase biotin carboxyl carrier protein [Chlamydiota bacterium]